MWDLVRNIRDRGSTVVLTTHFMEEAERLCDRVMIVDRGRIVAMDTPVALVNSLGVDQRLVFGLARGRDVAGLAKVSGVTRIERDDERAIVYGHGKHFASSVVSALEGAGVPFTDLRTQQPNLEDVFLALTGKEMRE